MFEENQKSLSKFCEDITEDPVIISKSLDAPLAGSWVVVVTVKPLEVLYRLVDALDSTSHIVSVSPNANVGQLRRRIAAEQHVSESEVQIWKVSPPRSRSVPALTLFL